MIHQRDAYLKELANYVTIATRIKQVGRHLNMSSSLILLVQYLEASTWQFLDTRGAFPLMFAVASSKERHSHLTTLGFFLLPSPPPELPQPSSSSQSPLYCPSASPLPVSIWSKDPSLGMDLPCNSWWRKTGQLFSQHVQRWICLIFWKLSVNINSSPDGRHL